MTQLTENIIPGWKATLIHIAGFFILLMGISFYSEAQSENAAKKDVSIDLVVSQVNADAIALKATAKVKWDSVFEGLSGNKVLFYSVSDSTETLVGTANTDFDGIAGITIKSGSIKPAADGTISFSAVIDSSLMLNMGKGEISAKRALVSIIPEDGDSLHSVSVKVVSILNGTETPVKDAEVYVFIKRLFSNYPIREALTTDENGMASIDIPAGLSGDENGNFTLLAKVEDHADYGNLEAGIVKPWGLKTKLDPLKQRTLWSHAPPLWMLITFIVLISVVWGHYFIIIYKLLRLKKQ